MSHALSRIAAALRRPISGQRRYFAEVDGLRFVAIGLVVISHIYVCWLLQPGREAAHRAVAEGWPPALRFFLQRGDNGVAVFFVLSAYIISRPFIAAARQEQQLSLRNYYLRRIVRIEPPYLIITTGIFLLYVLTGMEHVRYYGPHYGASMLYLHNIIFPHTYGLNDISWSLEVEVQFYLLAPLLFPVFRLSTTSRRLTLTALMLSAFILRHFWAPPFITLIQYAGFFIAGMLIAELLADGGRFGRGWRVLITALGVAGGVLALFGYFVPASATGWVAQASVPLLVLAALGPTPLRQGLRLKWVAIVGGMCYSIYLIHNLLLVFLFKYGFVWQPGSDATGDFVVNLCLLSVVVVAVGAVVYKLVEQPFMRRSAKYPLAESRRDDPE